MSGPEQALFEGRFRWAILRQMKELTELHGIAPDLLDAGFDKLYGAIRDAVWDAALRVPRPQPLDPAKIDLPEVRYFLRKTVEGIRTAVLNSPSKEVGS